MEVDKHLNRPSSATLDELVFANLANGIATLTPRNLIIVAPKEVVDKIATGGKFALERLIGVLNEWIGGSELFSRKHYLFLIWRS